MQCYRNVTNTICWLTTVIDHSNNRLYLLSEINLIMNSQLIVPMAVIVLMGIIITLIFMDRKEEKDLEEKFREDDRKASKKDIEMQDRPSI